MHRTRFRKLMMAYCLLLWQNSAFPQARDSGQPAYESIVHSVGPLISYKTEKYGISGKLSGAVCRIRAYSDNIIRG